MKEKRKVILSNYSIYNRIWHITILIWILIAYLFVCTKSLVDSFNEAKSIKLEILLLSIGIVFSAYLMYSLLNTKKLTKIQGFNRSVNQRIIENIANEWQLEVVNQTNDVSVLYKSVSSSFINLNKSLYVIYDQKDILVCCITFGEDDSISPFHVLANKNYMNRFKKAFLKDRKN